MQGNEKIDEIMFNRKSNTVIEFDKFFILPPLLEFLLEK